MDIQMFATCPTDITPWLAQEIIDLGGRDVRPGYRVVYFSASEKVFYEAHLRLRLASRLFRILKEIPANSPTIIFDKSKRIRFDRLFAPELPVTINVYTASKESPIPTHLIGSKIREAITDSFVHNLKVTPNLSSRDAKIGVTGYFYNNRLMIALDTSLKSLHKRGFRVEGHPAPLKETLAAALVMACEYDGQMPFYDPMCGSGSIAIEAAQIAMNKAPLIHRKKGEFGFEYHNDFNPSLWRQVQDETRTAQHEPKEAIFASDIESSYVEIARQTALKGRVEKYIKFSTRDFFQTEKPAERGTLIANIPYGLRLEDQEVSVEFLRSIGDYFKTHYKNWRCAILAPTAAPLKFIGLKSTRQVPFVNGTVPVKLVVFDIY